MDALTEGDKIFTKVAESVDWTKTTSLIEAKDLLTNLITETKGLVILDFLDSGNWDCIESIEANEDSGVLNLHWHDYREKEESDEDKEMRMLAFPAQLTSSLIKFKELRILKTKRFPVFLIRGYALKDKEIKALLVEGSSDYKLLDNKDNFSKLAVRKIDEHFETYTCFNTPIFSMIIIPKNCGVSAMSSKKALFSYNLNDSLARLDKVNKELDKEDLTDEDTICEKTNTVRRIFEYVLKVELCYRYRQVNVKKDYSNLLLGDLMKLVKPYREDSIQDLLTKITVWSNELSHESGKPITRVKASAVSYMTIMYTKLLESEMKIFPYPKNDE